MLTLKAIVEKEIVLASNQNTEFNQCIVELGNKVLEYINQYLENEELEFEILMSEIPTEIGKRPAGTGQLPNIKTH